MPAQVNPSLYFSLDDFEQAAYDSLSDGIKGLIQKSDEWAARNGTPNATPSASIADDDIPF